MGKIRVIVLGTGNATKQFIQNNIQSEYIDIVGMVLDDSVPEEDRRTFVRSVLDSLPIRIPVLDFSEDSFEQADIVFSPEYRRIIPQSFADRYVFVNCHGGILPKWRGFAANAWAIMNGEHEIGYSIHRVSAELDGGDVYFIKHIPIADDQTYADVHPIMLESITKEVPKVLYDIVHNNFKGTKQEKANFAYCTKFNKEMGFIRDFSRESIFYVNLFRCMSKPLGTGLFITYDDRIYSVGRVEHGKQYGSMDYFCIPGKVVNIENNQLWVKTKDNVIVLSDITCNGECIQVSKHFKNGMQL